MPTTFRTAVTNYLRSRNPARGTRAEYQTTLVKWKSWGGGVPIERLNRKGVREFLDWVYDRAIADEGTNPGRTPCASADHPASAKMTRMHSRLLWQHAAGGKSLTA